MRRIILITAVAVVAISAAAALSDSGRVQIGDGSVSALARAERSGDRLPSTVLAYPFAERNFSSRAGAGSRLLRADGSLKLYAVPGRGGMLCLVEVDDAARTAGGAWADRQVLLTGAIYMAEQRGDGTRNVVGLVADGHTFARAGDSQVRVENNAFVLHGIREDEVTIGSPTAAQTVEIGG